MPPVVINLHITRRDRPRADSPEPVWRGGRAGVSQLGRVCVLQTDVYRSLLNHAVDSDSRMRYVTHSTLQPSVYFAGIGMKIQYTVYCCIIPNAVDEDALLFPGMQDTARLSLLTQKDTLTQENM